MHAKIHTALYICTGSFLIALALALYGAAFPRFDLGRPLQTSSISKDSKMAKAAACTISDTKGEENDIFFISCGGIY